MPKLAFVLMVTTALNAHGQEVAEIDLTKAAPSSRLIQQALLPKECEAPDYVNSDGTIVSPKGFSQLALDLKVLNGETFSLGDRVKGEVTMKNVGSEGMDIPWTMDPQLSTRKVGSLQHDYELGWFEVELKNRDGSGVKLESESVSSFLYSSPSAPGTSLHLEPGQWIVARFDFILEEDRESSAGRRLKSGKADVAVDWRQALYTWRREDCRIETGYYSYGYQTKSKPAALEIWERPFPLLP